MFPVLLELGPLSVHSYGFLVVLGGLLPCLFLYRRRHRMGIVREESYWLLINVILIGGFLGGRFLHLIEYVPFSAPDFWEQVLSPSSGFSVYGAFFGVGVGVYAFSRVQGFEPLRVLDYVSQAAPLWHAFGRLGCFLAGCCHGRPLAGSFPWAVTFTDRRSQVPQELLGVPLHPAQLYETFGDLALAVFLYSTVLPRVESGRFKPGALCASYMVLYAVLRFITEHFRGDIIPLSQSGLTAAQAIALAQILFGLALYRAAPNGTCSRP